MYKHVPGGMIPDVLGYMTKFVDEGTLIQWIEAFKETEDVVIEAYNRLKDIHGDIQRKIQTISMRPSTRRRSKEMSELVEIGELIATQKENLRPDHVAILYYWIANAYMLMGQNTRALNANAEAYNESQKISERNPLFGALANEIEMQKINLTTGLKQ